MSKNNEVISSKCRSKISQSRILHPTKLSFKSLKKLRNISDTQMLRVYHKKNMNKLTSNACLIFI